MNIFEEARKALQFRESVENECKRRGMKVPSELKISEYMMGGYAIDLVSFMYDYTHFEGVFRLPKREPSPLEEKTLKATLEHLDESQLATLFNLWNEEIGVDNNAIYDLTNEGEVKFIADSYGIEGIGLVSDAVRKGVRFVHIFEDGINGTRLLEVTNMKKLITDIWAELFERIVLFPQCYDYDYTEGLSYFSNVIAPIMFDMLGYNVDYQVCEVTYKGAK